MLGSKVKKLIYFKYKIFFLFPFFLKFFIHNCLVKIQIVLFYSQFLGLIKKNVNFSKNTYIFNLLDLFFVSWNFLGRIWIWQQCLDPDPQHWLSVWIIALLMQWEGGGAQHHPDWGGGEGGADPEGHLCRGLQQHLQLYPRLPGKISLSDPE